jgi:hypothetical protein
MRAVTGATVWIAVVSVCVVCAQWTNRLRAQSLTERDAPKASFEMLVERIASASPDWCQGPLDDNGSSEAVILRRAAEEVLDRVNDGLPAADASSEDRAVVRAREALDKLKQASARINASWPEESRFRGEVVVVVSPLLLVNATFRNRWALYVLGASGLDDRGTSSGRWRIVESPGERVVPRLTVSLEVFSVYRPPSQRARFLTRILGGGCAGSVGLFYRLFEWDPRRFGDLTTLITIDGVATQEEPSKLKNLSGSFPPVGTFQPQGPVVTLPYCYWSVVDTWDNPSLCAADSFDVSGDRVRFQSRVTNRPDLLPIAAVIKHAQAHEYRAVLAYCRSASIARQIVAAIPEFIFANTLKVTRLGAGKERVEFGFPDVYRFDVERGRPRWEITRFRVERRIE